MKAFWQHGLLKEFKGSSDNFRAGLTDYMVFMVITSPFMPTETRLLQNKRPLGREKPGDGSDGSPTWLQMCTRCAIQRCRILNQIFLRHNGMGTCGQQYYHHRGKVRDFWTHRIFRRIANSEDSRWGLRDYRFHQWFVSAV
jgi:hypothetical protein